MGNQISNNINRLIEKIKPPPPPPPPERYNVPLDNYKEIVSNQVNNKVEGTFRIGSHGSFDSAPGCLKGFTSTYKCSQNGNIKNINIPATAHWQPWGYNVNYSCKNEMNKCKNSKLELRDNGNLVMLNSDGNIVWNSNTNKVGIPNEKYKAINGKYKRNYLKTGEYLKINEFIGSPSGNCILKLIKNNNNIDLVIMYDIIGCENPKDGSIINPGIGFVGSDTSNYGLYSLNKVDRKNIGKVFYVDMDGKKREYPEHMVTLDNTYENLGNYDSYGNDIEGGLNKNSTIEKCKSWCNNNDNCYGFVFNNNTKWCFPKSKNMWPNNSKRIPNISSNLYIRNKKVDNKNCSNSMNIIDAERINNIPDGKIMNVDTLCNLYMSLFKQNNLVTKKEKELELIANEINNEINNLLKNKSGLDDSILKYIKETQKNIIEYNNLNKSKPNIKKENKNYGDMNETTIEEINNNKKKLVINSILISVFVIIIILLLK